MNVSKQVSIIVSAFNTANYITDCVDSLLNMTDLRNFEWEILIGVDGCQKTLNVLEKYIGMENITVYYQKINQGCYPTTNFLIKQSKYQNILIFNSDDIAYPKLLKSVAMYFDKNYDAVRFKGGQSTNMKNFTKTSFGHGVLVVNKKAFEKWGFYKNVRCAADRIFLKKIARNKACIININTVLFLRRLHPSSLTKCKEYNMRSQYRKNVARGIIKETAIIPLNEITTQEIFKNMIETVSKPVVKTVSKPVVKTVSKPVVKTVSKPVVKTASKPVVKTASKPVVKTVSKPVVKTVSKPIVKTVSKPVSKIVPKFFVKNKKQKNLIKNKNLKKMDKKIVPKNSKNEQKILEPIEQHLESIEQQLETIEQHLETIEEQLETNQQHLETNEQQLETNEKHLETNEQHLETNEQHLETNEQQKVAIFDLFEKDVEITLDTFDQSFN